MASTGRAHGRKCTANHSMVSSFPLAQRYLSNLKRQREIRHRRWNLPRSLASLPGTSCLRGVAGAVSTWSGLSKSALTLICHLKSSVLARKQRKPHKTKAIEMPKEGIVFPLESEYDYANSTLEGLRQTSPPSLLELPKFGRSYRAICTSRRSLDSDGCALDENPCYSS